jgi:hypothetical protein
VNKKSFLNKPLAPLPAPVLSQTKASHELNNIKKDVIPKSIFPSTLTSTMVNKMPPITTGNSLEPALSQDTSPKTFMPLSINNQSDSQIPVTFQSRAKTNQSESLVRSNLPVNTTQLQSTTLNDHSNTTVVRSNLPITFTEALPSLILNQSQNEPVSASWRQYFPSYFPANDTDASNQQANFISADQANAKYDVTKNTIPAQPNEVKVGKCRGL